MLIEAPGDLTRRRIQSSPFDRGQRRLERFGRTADAAEFELRVFEEAEVGAALADGKLGGMMPVAAERLDAELGDAQRLARGRSFAERQKNVRAGVIGNRAVSFLICSAPPGQATHRIRKGSRAARRSRGIERLDWKLL